MKHDEHEERSAYVDATLNHGEALQLDVGAPTKTMALECCTGDAVETTKIAVVDFEGTGRQPATAEPIECAITLLAVDRKCGAVVSVIEQKSWLGEPAGRIPEEVTRLTGIDDTMVRGRHIDAEALSAIMDAAEIIVAHNASYDRALSERIVGQRADLWCCTLRDIDWSTTQVLGMSLSALCASHGRVWPAHRAANDVAALVWLVGERDRARRDRGALARTLLEVAYDEDVIIACKTAGYPGEDAVTRMRSTMRWSPDAKLWWRTERCTGPEQAQAIVNEWALRMSAEWRIPRVKIAWGMIPASVRHRQIDDPRTHAKHIEDAAQRAAKRPAELAQHGSNQ